MNRRQLLKTLPMATILSLPAVAESEKMYNVEVLEPLRLNSYTTLKSFSTQEEAFEFVRHIRPELAKVVVAREEGDNVIRSGYRGAIRYTRKPTERIVCTNYLIVDDRQTGVDRILTGIGKPPILFDIGLAWLWISNIRVNGQIVPREDRLHPFLSMPFKRGNPEIKYIGELNGTDSSTNS